MAQHDEPRPPRADPTPRAPADPRHSETGAQDHAGGAEASASLRRLGWTALMVGVLATIGWAAWAL